MPVVLSNWPPIAWHRDTTDITRPEGYHCSDPRQTVFTVLQLTALFLGTTEPALLLKCGLNIDKNACFWRKSRRSFYPDSTCHRDRGLRTGAIEDFRTMKKFVFQILLTSCVLGEFLATISFESVSKFFPKSYFATRVKKIK